MRAMPFSDSTEKNMEKCKIRKKTQFVIPERYSRYVEAVFEVIIHEKVFILFFYVNCESLFNLKKNHVRYRKLNLYRLLDNFLKTEYRYLN